jgi:hypothetical protein
VAPFSQSGFSTTLVVSFCSSLKVL